MRKLTSFFSVCICLFFSLEVMAKTNICNGIVNNVSPFLFEVSSDNPNTTLEVNTLETLALAMRFNRSKYSMPNSCSNVFASKMLINYPFNKYFSLGPGDASAGCIRGKNNVITCRELSLLFIGGGEEH